MIIMRCLLYREITMVRVSRGLVVRDGTFYIETVMGDDVCILRSDGTLNIYEKSEFNALSMLNDTVWQAWAFGPALVENGSGM